MRNQKGFTLIELMIVIAIVGILVMVAMPSYQNYMKKAAYSEVIAAMSPIRSAIDICYAMEQSLDDCNTAEKIGEILPTGLTERALNKIEIESADKVVAITATPNNYKGIVGVPVADDQTDTNANEYETCVSTPEPDASNRLIWTYSGACVEQGYVKS